MQITDSLKHFGLSPSTTSLVLVHIAPSTLPTDDAAAQQRANEDVLRRMEAVVEGELVGLEALGRLSDGGTDEKALRKVRFAALPKGWTTARVRRFSRRSY